MTRRSFTRRFVFLAAPAALVAGAMVAPTSAFAAPATPRAITMDEQGAGRGDRHHRDTGMSATKWTQTKDAASGIAVKLPGKPMMRKIPTESALDYQGRVYAVRTSDGFMYFAVFDIEGAGPGELSQLVEGTRQGMAEDFGGAAITRQKHLTSDGHAAVDARLNSMKGKPVVTVTRLVADDEHVVQVVTVGSQAHEKSVDNAQAQAVASLRFP
ncbi:hypothetical protein [Streptomyces siamensis]|uniref:Uncharacterized protein n=1 Tax=Streptomyces siamensis TaxID=1274986 RepID=A0ABP9IR50_9ACTN